MTILWPERRTITRLATALGAATLAVLMAVPAAASGVPAAPEARPADISGSQWTCTFTNPEYMIHAGGADLAVRPGHASFAVLGTRPGAMTDPYITVGYNSDLSSELCNDRELPGSGGRYGWSPALPVRLGTQGHPVATVSDWTSGAFRGDAGFDIWFSSVRSRTTYSTLTNGGDGTTEIMVWLAHPNLGRYSSYPARVDGRKWMVTIGLAAKGHGRSAAHPHGWNVVNFIAPDTHEGSVTVHQLKLNSFISYAIARGWLQADDYLMSVNQGFEDFKGTAAVRAYALTGLR